MLDYTFKDVQQNVMGPDLKRGIEYQRQGRVVHFGTNGEDEVFGSVRGNINKPYEVSVLFYDELYSDDVEIDGFCTCPVGHNCKHVVAVLLENLYKKPNARQLASSATRADENSFDVWLADLHRTLNPQANDLFAPNVNQRLLYLLSLDTFKEHELQLNLFTARRLKNGGYGKASQYNIDINKLYNPAKYLLPCDVDTLGHLFYLQSTHFSSRWYFSLSRFNDPYLLEKILLTGRAHWVDRNTPALKLAKPRKATLNWIIDSDGNQRPNFVTTPPSDVIVEQTPPWYVDLQQFEMGQLNSELPYPVARDFLRMPAITPAQVQPVSKKLKQSLKEFKFSLPLKVKTSKQKSIVPVPCLHLYNIEVDLSIQKNSVAVARLSFDYQNTKIEHGSNDNMVFIYENGTPLGVMRNQAEEKNAVSLLRDFGFIETYDCKHIPYAMQDPADWYLQSDYRHQALMRFSIYGIAKLRQLGWQVTIDDNYTYQGYVAADEWYLDLDHSSEMDWFDLELGILSGGEKINLLPIILNLMHKYPSKMELSSLEKLPDDFLFNAKLTDGRDLPIPVQRLRHILSTLIELYDWEPLSESNRLSMSRFQASQVSELAGQMDQSGFGVAGKEILELGRKLQNFSNIKKVAVPKALKTELRSYQKSGLDWLQFLREYGLSGILADDMGLGKTVQVLAHLAKEKQAGRLKNRPSLVVAPTSLMGNWRSEAHRFTPKLSVLVLHGADRKDNFDSILDYDLVLTTYPLLYRDFDNLANLQFYLLILDEAQYIKNPKSKSSQSAALIQSKYRLCLTGTPMENHLGEMWSLFNFLLPGFLGTENQFNKVYRKPIEIQHNQSTALRLRQRVAPFILRRTKSQVMAELPPKTIIDRKVELHGSQRDLYETIRLAMHQRVQQEIDKKGFKRSQIIILDALLKLRQVCCHPKLLQLPAAKKVDQSAKFDLIMDMIPELLEEGRRILLFSQFTSMLSLIEAELQSKNIKFVKLTGQTRNREEVVNKFQAGEVPLFLISLKAGGTGLNLTAADTVIHYDPWWNPAVENQATDRAYRIGQDKPVFVYRLIAEGSIEEKIVNLQERKQKISESVLGQGNVTQSFTKQDLEVLFQPLS